MAMVAWTGKSTLIALPDTSSLLTKHPNKLEVPGLGHHIEGLKLLELVSGFEQVSGITNEGVGVARDIDDVFGREGDDMGNGIFGPLTGWIEKKSVHFTLLLDASVEEVGGPLPGEAYSLLPWQQIQSQPGFHGMDLPSMSCEGPGEIAMPGVQFEHFAGAWQRAGDTDHMLNQQPVDLPVGLGERRRKDGNYGRWFILHGHL